MPREAITIRSVRDPRWNYDGVTIDCWVKADHLAQEVPFTASPFDTEPHGRDIHARIVAGEFGPIAPAPTEPPEPITPSALPAFLMDFAPFIEDANAENTSGSERGSVLVHAAFLDVTLEKLLTRKGLDATGSFANRTRRAADAGLISHSEKADIDSIRGIRNAFAHEIGPKLETYRATCEQMYERNVGDAARFSPRLSFSMASMGIIMRLAERAHS